MTLTRSIPLAVVGIGAIARNQHLPSIAKSPSFTLGAAVSRGATVEGVDNFTSLDALLAKRSDIPVVVLCTPPQVRFEMAWKALQAGKHVMLEKPPGATLSEVETLRALAEENGLTLLASWHSRHAPAVEPAKKWLAGRQVQRVEIVWKEDVRRWHPGQAWIWQAGGLGVFDPGINALSILTHIMPHNIHLTGAELEFPSNCETPIAANLKFADQNGADIGAVFDWRQEGPQTWEISVVTDNGSMVLTGGGSAMNVDGAKYFAAEEAEYDSIYSHFAELLAAGRSDVDTSPLRHVADAFMLGRRQEVDAFIE